MEEELDEDDSDNEHADDKGKPKVGQSHTNSLYLMAAKVLLQSLKCFNSVVRRFLLEMFSGHDVRNSFPSQVYRPIEGYQRFFLCVAPEVKPEFTSIGNDVRYEYRMCHYEWYCNRSCS